MPHHELIGRRDLSPSAYVLRIERGEMQFTPGQYITVGAAGDIESREYSVYSGAEDPCLEVLIKEVSGGSVSRQLRRLPPGSALAVEGPFGFFTIAAEHARGPLLFVASGTGIAPFRAMVRSDPALDYLLLHGVRTLDDCYESAAYSADRYVPCVSRGSGGFQGRVTDYLREHPVAASTPCFLCGNSAMIFAAFDLLKSQGVPSENLFAEVYF